jgi:hypothetical protein
MSVPAPPGDDLPARLRLALTVALRARDMTAASALRSALGAIGNAEAIPMPLAASGAGPSTASAAGASAASASAARASAASASAAGASAAGRGSPHVAGAVAGLGAAEAERRRLSRAQVAAIVQAEIDERLAAAAQYRSAGHADRAARLAAEAQALASAAGVAE